jgi:hypothetical protein
VGAESHGGSAPASGAAARDQKRSEARRLLFQSIKESDHRWAREILRNDEDFSVRVFEAYLRNPFLRLTEQESVEAATKLRPAAIGQMIAVRDGVTRTSAPRYALLGMPKSGSSFLSSALQHTFDLPMAMLTSFGAGGVSSLLGMNSREQELDELAVIKSILMSSQGFVAQHHTRYSQYLGLQLKLYGLTPLISVRNALDCIVSFDDMMMARSPEGQHWVFDAQFALPTGYSGLSDEVRYTILTHSFGVWLINFYLSWKRGVQQAIVSPLIIKYEDHVLNPDALVEHLNERIPMTGKQIETLRAYANEPDRARSRLNVGARGRGAELMPEHLQQFLADYAGLFEGDLTRDEIQYLVR